MQTPCHPASCQTVGNVKAAGVGVDVQDLACKVEAWDFLAFQGFGIDFLEVNATLGHKGLGQGHLACNLDREGFEESDQFSQVLLGNLFDLAIVVFSEKVC